jgi:hypothetical protein
MPKCRYCGGTTWEDETVCSYCGQTIARQSGAPAAAQPPPRKVAPPPPQSRATPRLTGELATAVSRYMAAGYSLTARTQSMAILERRVPFNELLLVIGLLLFWPLLIFPLAPKLRKVYRVHLSADDDGPVIEVGGTLEEFERDRKRRRTIGWIVLGVIAVVLFIIVASGTS